MAFCLFIVVWSLFELEKLVPPTMISNDQFCAYWIVDVISTSLCYIIIYVLRMEFMFTPLNCALLLYFVIVGMIVLSWYLFKLLK